MTVYDRGDALTHEVTFKQYSPHVVTPAYADPTSATISIMAPSGSYIVASAVLSKTSAGSTGLYHYTMQSSTNWEKGIYQVEAKGVLGYVSLTVAERSFELE